MPKINKNLHAIWVTFNNKIPDEVVSNLELWKETLPKDWKLCFWCNLDNIEPAYLNYLHSIDIIVLDVHTIISAAQNPLKGKLLYLLEHGKEIDYLHIKLFSDVMRMLLMSMQGSDLFSGIYLDITGAVPTQSTTQKLDNLVLKHGIAFRVNSEINNIDSNVSIFSSDIDNESFVKKFIGTYFARLQNWDIYSFMALKNISKCAITNVFNLLNTDYNDRSMTKLFTGEKIPTDEIDAGKLLSLLPDQGDPELHFTRNFESFESKLNFAHSNILDKSSIIFPSPNYSLLTHPNISVPFCRPNSMPNALSSFSQPLSENSFFQLNKNNMDEISITKPNRAGLKWL